jgi:hypothetical protein
VRRDKMTRSKRISKLLKKLNGWGEVRDTEGDLIGRGYIISNRNGVVGVTLNEKHLPLTSIRQVDKNYYGKILVFVDAAYYK